MTSPQSSWDAPAFRAEVQSALDAFVDEQALRLAPLGDDAARLVDAARAAVSGGKRFRAAFCAWGFRAVREEGAGRRRPGAGRLRARGAARERAGARRLHGRLGHPPRPAGDPQGLRGAAPRERLDRRPAAVRRRRGDPARGPAAVLVRRAAAALRDAARRGPRRAGVLRHDPQRGDRRAVPRRLGAGARRLRRGAGDAGAALQVREVLHRAAVARRRRAGRRGRRTCSPR